MALHWTAELSVGVAELDDQHKRILSYINILNESIDRNDSKLFIQDLLDALHDHMSSHFASEERYFAEFNYAGAAEHRFMHAEFLKHLIHSIASYKLSGILSKEDKDILFNWMADHIRGVDKMYVEFFHAHGLY